jgi:hypothetical protein
VHSTYDLNIIADHGNLIYAIGTMEAFCTLKAVVFQFDWALYDLITQDCVLIAATR